MDGLNFSSMLVSTYEFDFTPVWEGIPELLKGLWVTIALTVTVMVLSLPLGFGVAFARRSRFWHPALGDLGLHGAVPDHAAAGPDLLHVLRAAGPDRRILRQLHRAAGGVHAESRGVPGRGLPLQL